jgi:hypothetical protein
MTTQREKILAVICGWVGRSESDGSHRKIIDIYNAEKPLARGYAVKPTDAWCAATVSAAAIAAGVPRSIFPRECGCGKMIEGFQKLGAWVENDAYKPTPGDVIMYDWQDNGVGDNKGAPDHVGIVEGVSGGKIRVVEGNINNAVGYRTIAVGAKCIRGYCVPKYADEDKPDEVTSAIQALARAGHIANAEYWIDAVKSNKVKYLGDMLIKFAAVVAKKGA